MFSFSMMRCPRCMKAGEFNIVQLKGGMTTCMGCITPNDLEGNKHDHDGNETTYGAECGRCGPINISINEHRIEVRYNETAPREGVRSWSDVFVLPPPTICWCGWPHSQPELKKLGGDGPFLIGEDEGVVIVNAWAVKK